MKTHTPDSFSSKKFLLLYIALQEKNLSQRKTLKHTLFFLTKDRHLFQMTAPLLVTSSKSYFVEHLCLAISLLGNSKHI